MEKNKQKYYNKKQHSSEDMKIPLALLCKQDVHTVLIYAILNRI